jgi:ParB/RepB/Spo0J family partition protein
METQVLNSTEYRNVPLSLLNVSKTNPRRTFDEVALKELAESIRAQGILSPLLVRPLTENGFEIVFGERRYRAAQLAEQEAVPVRIKQMSDAEALEAQLVENLIRAEIHPMEEAQGFRALLNLEEPKYSIEQIAAKVGKSPAFVASRLKLTDLFPAAVEAFYADEIGVGHALLLAKLPADQQEQALSACFKEVYNGASKPARILLPVRNMQFWIDSNILLVLKDAPFNKRDAQLVPAAGSCADCPKRTGHNKLLFGDDLGRQGDRCTDPPAIRRRYRHTSPRPLPRSRSWYRSARLTVHRKKAARYSHVTSTPPFGTISKSRKMRRSGLSSKCASSPPRPSSPRGAMLVASTRSAQTHHARFIIRSSKPAATMRRRRPNRRSSARNRPLPRRLASVSSPL